jgi:hypothetical protein
MRFYRAKSVIVSELMRRLWFVSQANNYPKTKILSARRLMNDAFSK